MAKKQNLNIDSGSNFLYIVALLNANDANFDVTGYTANASIKPWYTYGNVVSFDVALSNGSLTLSMNSSTTATLTKETYVWDAVLTSNTGNTDKIIEGIIYVRPTISS